MALIVSYQRPGVFYKIKPGNYCTRFFIGGVMQNNNCQITIAQYVENYRSATQTETKISNAGWKVTPTQKVALEHIAQANGTTVSGLIQAAVDLYMLYLPHVDVLRSNDEIIAPLLQRMR